MRPLHCQAIFYVYMTTTFSVLPTDLSAIFFERQTSIMARYLNIFGASGGSLNVIIAKGNPQYLYQCASTSHTLTMSIFQEVHLLRHPHPQVILAKRVLCCQNAFDLGHRSLGFQPIMPNPNEPLYAAEALYFF